MIASFEEYFVLAFVAGRQEVRFFCGFFASGEFISSSAEISIRFSLTEVLNGVVPFTVIG